MWKIYFLLWVSGSGKTTLFHELDQIDQSDFVYIPSYTSRDMRPWEVQGEKYRHISPDEFDQAIADGEFLERAHSTASETKYGSKSKDLIEPTKHWKNTIKETDAQWLLKMIQEWKLDERFVTIFLDIDDATISDRLKMRWSAHEIENRTRIAQSERDIARKHCDHIIDAARELSYVRKDFFEILGINI